MCLEIMLSRSNLQESGISEKMELYLSWSTRNLPKVTEHGFDLYGIVAKSNFKTRLVPFLLG